MTTQNNETPAQNETTTPAELPMEQYAAQLESKLYGKSLPKEVPAAAVEVASPDANEVDDIVDIEATDDDSADGKTPTESATEDGKAADESLAGKGKKGIQKRFSEMTAKQKELQAEAERARAEAEAMKREAEAAKAEAERLRLEAERAQNAIPKVPEAEEDPFPDRNDFDDPDVYAAAIAAHAAREELRKASLKAKTEAEARAAEARQKADEAQREQALKVAQDFQAKFQQKVVDAKQEYPDFDEKVTNNENIVLRNDVFFAIQGATDSPHILYHLADRPDLVKELNGISNPMQAALRIGEIQAELRLSRKPKVSRAADPIRPIGNRASPQPKTLDEMSPEEYAAEVARREKAAGRQASRVRII